MRIEIQEAKFTVPVVSGSQENTVENLCVSDGWRRRWVRQWRSRSSSWPPPAPWWTRSASSWLSSPATSIRITRWSGYSARASSPQRPGSARPLPYSLRIPIFSFCVMGLGSLIFKKHAQKTSYFKIKFGFSLRVYSTGQFLKYIFFVILEKICTGIPDFETKNKLLLQDERCRWMRYNAYIWAARLDIKVGTKLHLWRVNVKTIGGFINIPLADLSQINLRHNNITIL